MWAAEDLCFSMCVFCTIWYYAFVMSVCVSACVYFHTCHWAKFRWQAIHTLRSGVRRAASLITAHHRKLSRWPPSNTSMATTATDMHTNKKGQTLTSLSFTLFLSLILSHGHTHQPYSYLSTPQKKSDRFEMGRMVVRLTSLQFILFFYFNTFGWCF